MKGSALLAAVSFAIALAIVALMIWIDRRVG